MAERGANREKVMAVLQGLTSAELALPAGEIAEKARCNPKSMCFQFQALRAGGADVVMTSGFPPRYWLRRQVQAGSIPVRVPPDSNVAPPESPSAGTLRPLRKSTQGLQNPRSQPPGLLDATAIGRQIAEALQTVTPTVEVRKVTLELSISLTREG